VSFGARLSDVTVVVRLRNKDGFEREDEDTELNEPEAESAEEVPIDLDAKNIIGRGRQGRDAWLREGKRNAVRGASDVPTHRLRGWP
jgi:hypothetical protein